MSRYYAGRTTFLSLFLALICLTSTVLGHKKRLRNRADNSVKTCKEVSGTLPPAFMEWGMTSSIGYQDDNLGTFNIQGVSYIAEKESQTWGFGADMKYTAITRFQTYDDYSISVKGKHGGDNTDGYYYVTFERVDQSIIRAFYISHLDSCTFKPITSGEMLEIEQVWINQYIPMHKEIPAANTNKIEDLSHQGVKAHLLK